MDVVIALLHSFEHGVLVLLLTMPRFYAFFASSQLLNAALLPRMPRNAAILSFTLMLVPMHMEFASDFKTGVSLLFVVHFVKEYAIGYLLGYLVGWMTWVMQTAGSLIDSQRGSGMTGSFDIIEGEETTPLGNLFSQSFLTYIMVSGSFLYIISLVYKSYVICPIGIAVRDLPTDLPVMVLQIFDYATGLSVVLSGPIVASMFVAEFALAIVGRFAPQIQVFILVMPIKTLVTMVIMVFYFSSALSYIDSVVWGQEIAFSRLYLLLWPESY